MFIIYSEGLYTYVQVVDWNPWKEGHSQEGLAKGAAVVMNVLFVLSLQVDFAESLCGEFKDF